MKKILTVLGMVAVLMPVAAFAAYFNSGKDVSVGPAQAIDQNAYMAGGTLTVSAPIAGDLLAAGGTLFLSGKVDQDIMAAGGTITLAGTSAQDVRIAGGTATIGGTFSGELMAAGGTILVTPDSNIAKDSYIRGGTVTFNGNEAGNLDIAGGTVYVGGTVNGNLTIRGTQSVIIGSSAVIHGNLDYTAPVPVTIESGAQVLGVTTFHQIQPAMAQGRAEWLSGLIAFLAFLWILKLMMVLFIAYLLWYVCRKDMVRILTESMSHFWRELLIGFIFLVVVPVAIVIAFMSIVGVLLGGIAALVYVALLLIAFPVSVIVASSFIMKRRTDLRWYHILLGAVVLEIAKFIPLIGWGAYLLIYLASLGAMLTGMKSRFQK